MEGLGGRELAVLKVLGEGRPLEGSARCQEVLGGHWEALRFWEGLSPEENSSRYLASRGCYSTPGCGQAGERAGSTCTIDVEGHKRRPPSKVRPMP